jgi:hypothetical protein
MGIDPAWYDELACGIYDAISFRKSSRVTYPSDLTVIYSEIYL